MNKWLLISNFPFLSRPVCFGRGVFEFPPVKVRCWPICWLLHRMWHHCRNFTPDLRQSGSIGMINGLLGGVSEILFSEMHGFWCQLQYWHLAELLLLVAKVTCHINKLFFVRLAAIYNKTPPPPNLKTKINFLFFYCHPDKPCTLYKRRYFPKL